MAKKYMSLERLTEYDALIKAKIDGDIANHEHSWDELNDKPFYESREEYINDYGDNEELFYDLRDGKEVTCVVNGTEYTLTGKKMDYSYTNDFGEHSYKVGYVGNIQLYTMASINANVNLDDYASDDVPFVVVLHYDDYAEMPIPTRLIRHETLSNSEVTCNVYKETLVQLDSKFIGDDIARTTYVDTQLATKADATHSHNDIYYTETEVDNLIAGVNTSITNITSGTTAVKEAEHATSADSATTADSATDADKLGGQLPSYYAKASDIPTGALASKDIVSESDLDSALAAKVNAAAEGNHSHSNKTVLDGITSDKVSAWDSSLDEAKAYTDTKTNGMATTTVVDNKISAHNTSTTAHSDIRDLISALTTKVNNFLDVDDTTTDELSEVLTLINNNKGTLESLTSSKINVSDIVDNLTTSNASKVLSAKQGVALKGLIDALQTAVDGKAASVHTHAIGDVTNLQSTLNAKASQADLEALEEVVNGKASASHSHAIADVSGLQSALDGKAAASHGIHVTYDSTNKPKMDGTAAFGTSASVARADHVHPTDTSRASQADLDALETVVSGKANASHTHAISEVTNLQSALDAKATTSALTTHTNNADIHFTADERTKLAGIATGANKTTVDSSLSSTSTNPVQNKIVNQAIVSLTSTVSTNTNAISSNTSAISSLQTEVNSWEEITSAEIQSLFAN